jgi:hypothetical protein
MEMAKVSEIMNCPTWGKWGEFLFARRIDLRFYFRVLGLFLEVYVPKTIFYHPPPFLFARRITLLTKNWETGTAESIIDVRGKGLIYPNGFLRIPRVHPGSAGPCPISAGPYPFSAKLRQAAPYPTCIQVRAKTQPVLSHNRTAADDPHHDGRRSRRKRRIYFTVGDFLGGRDIFFGDSIGA